MSDTGVTASSHVTYAEDINRQQQDKDVVQGTQGLCLSATSSRRTNNNNFIQPARVAGTCHALDVLVEGASKPAVSINHLALIISSLHRGELQQQRDHKAGLSHVCFIRGVLPGGVGTAS